MACYIATISNLKGLLSALFQALMIAWTGRGIQKCSEILLALAPGFFFPCTYYGLGSQRRIGEKA